jgi:hypothetical protein
MGEVAPEGCMRGGIAIVGVIFLDDELALGKCPFYEGIMWRRARDERMWSRLPHPLHLLGRPRPQRLPRL